MSVSSLPQSAGAGALRRLARSRRFLARAVDHERDYGRLGFWLPVWAAIGVAAAVALPFDPPVAAVTAAAALLGAARVAAARLSGAVTLTAPLTIAFAVLLGASAVTVQATYFGTPVLGSPRSAEVEGRIVSSERLSPGRQRIVLALQASDLSGPAPVRVRLAVRGGPDLPVGARVRAGARLFPLRGPVMPGGYDAARRLYFDRIGATGFTYGPPAILEPPPQSLRATIHAVRQAVAARVAAAMPAETAPFATALLVGQRGAMAPRDTEALRASGLGHILAISGLHMALVAGSVFAAVRLGLALVPRLALAHPIRKWAAIAGLVAATLYLALSGGSVATQRAYIMLCVALIAVLADRPALTMRTVAIAAVLCMALDPISVLEPSFQMSFLAVVALVGAYEWWSSRRLGRPARERRPTPLAAFFTGLGATSLIAGFATGPAAVFHFHRVAPLGLLANLLAMPIFSLVAMPAGVIALALMPLGAEAAPLWVMDHALRAVLWVAHQAADWTGTAGLTGAISPAAALLMTAGILWLAIMTAPWRLAGTALIVVGLALSPTAERPDILVADDGALIAARAADGRLALIGRRGSFAAQAWLKADGDGRRGRDLAEPLCDAAGCTLALANGRLAAPLTLRALREDCRLARVVVSRHRVPACGPSALVVDREVLRRHGSVTFTADGDGDWRRRTAWPHGPVRAWQVRPTVEYP